MKYVFKLYIYRWPGRRQYFTYVDDNRLVGITKLNKILRRGRTLLKFTKKKKKIENFKALMSCFRI